MAAGLAGCGSITSASTLAPPVAAPTDRPAPAPTLGVIPTVAPIPITSGIAPPPPTAAITMLTGAPFDPAVLTVVPGTIITVTNRGHANCNLSDPAHGLGSGDLGPGASVHMTAPDTPGTYHYACTGGYDESGLMKGTLIVSPKTTTPAGPASAAPTPTPSSTPAVGSDTASAGSPASAPPTGTPTPSPQPSPPHKKHKKPALQEPSSDAPSDEGNGRDDPQ